MMSDLRQRVPGHSLVDELLRQWDVGNIHVDAASDGIVIDDEAVGWYRGVIGERRVAELLGHLNSSWTVLHSVPVGSGTSDIDHVVIGESGVFTINTKYSPGKKVWVGGYGLYVDGFQQQYVRNSVSEAARASDLLSRATGMTVPVTALIVFVDSGPMTHKAAAGGGIGTPEIRVMRDVELLATFAPHPIFSAAQAQHIVASAVLPETWHTAPAASTIGRHVSQEFEALEAAVGPRLARPVARPSTPAASRESRRARAAANRPRASASRPPARRTGRSRKSKQSRLEKLITGLLLPGIAFAVVAFMLSHYGQR